MWARNHQHCPPSAAAWGGYLELTALSAALQRQIRVHAVGMDASNLSENVSGGGDRILGGGAASTVSRQYAYVLSVWAVHALMSTHSQADNATAGDGALDVVLLLTGS